MDKDNGIRKELRRFFLGKKSGRGEHIFNRWFHSFDDSKGYANRLSEEEREEHRRQLYGRLKNNLRMNVNPVSPYSYHLKRWMPFYKVAAILIVVGALVLLNLPRLVLEEEVIPVSMVQKSNPQGQISTLILPDGSKVWLSAASTLEYPEKFTDTSRTIKLSGEAYFEVNRDAVRPFIVNTGPVSTRVLGTSFNIRAYQDDPDIAITLASGEVEVAVNDGSQRQVLATNEQIRYEKEGKLSEVVKVDASLSVAWKQQELVFLRESFETIARTFERWYGVEFVFEDESLKDETFVYHFKDLSLHNSMVVLNELADFDYDILDQKVIIKNDN